MARDLEALRHQLQHLGDIAQLAAALTAVARRLVTYGLPGQVWRQRPACRWMMCRRGRVRCLAVRQRAAASLEVFDQQFQLSVALQ
ncbi:hypothetical protein AAW51_0400 [Caldimonas brevitalea]|uniref:Uncharacterized protein n=1 Tax=Caldimonas brevitalea TaxID=413882 RepID=A0A0G3BI94_9BURK|nr:hypothetical protein AAW51_0400 [Caldimonas brevitalea]